jgi:hypothetical protein
LAHLWLTMTVSIAATKLHRATEDEALRPSTTSWALRTSGDRRSFSIEWEGPRCTVGDRRPRRHRPGSVIVRAANLSESGTRGATSKGRPNPRRRLGFALWQILHAVVEATAQISRPLAFIVGQALPGPRAHRERRASHPCEQACGSVFFGCLIIFYNFNRVREIPSYPREIKTGPTAVDKSRGEVDCDLEDKHA